jgi:hypothetical protein
MIGHRWFVFRYVRTFSIPSVLNISWCLPPSCKVEQYASAEACAAALGVSVLLVRAALRCQSARRAASAASPSGHASAAAAAAAEAGPSRGRGDPGVPRGRSSPAYAALWAALAAHGHWLAKTGFLGQAADLGAAKVADRANQPGHAADEGQGERLKSLGDSGPGARLSVPLQAARLGVAQLRLRYRAGDAKLASSGG